MIHLATTRRSVAKIIIILAAGILAALIAAENTIAQDRAKTITPQSGRTISNSAYIDWVSDIPKRFKKLPAGVQHLRFKSKLVDREISYLVYLPDAYAKQRRTRFPVIYTLHGNNNNEFSALPSAKLLHQQIAAGKTPPMMMVFFNGGNSTFYKNSADGKLPIESIFLAEFIPHIDATFRTIADGKGRCIEGFSMGGRGSTRLAVKHPEMFCSLFCQAGNMPSLVDAYKRATPQKRAQSMLGTDPNRWLADDVYVNCTKNQRQIKRGLQIRIACGTADPGHLGTVRRFHKHLNKLGIDHGYTELEGLDHNQGEMRRILASSWFDSHVAALRQSGAIK